MGRAHLVPLFFLFCCCCSHLSLAQSPIPAKYDGFVYGASPVWGDSILVEAFFDPVCPDSRDSWPPLKQALHFYSPRVSFVVHPFSLAFHDNAYVACRALHIANKLNASSTYPLLELFFKYQQEYYNEQTQNMSRASIINDMAKLAVIAVGNSSLPAIEEGFRDPQTDVAAKTSFKYGCSSGVGATPSFFVNGFALAGAGSALDYSEWRSILDPLAGKR